MHVLLKAHYKQLKGKLSMDFTVVRKRIRFSVAATLDPMKNARYVVDKMVKKDNMDNFLKRLVNSK